MSSTRQSSLVTSGRDRDRSRAATVTDLERAMGGDREMWIDSLKVASESPEIDLTTAGILDHIRHLLAIGQLVDRDAIDDETLQYMIDRRNAYALGEIG